MFMLFQLLLLAVIAMTIVSWFKYERAKTRFANWRMFRNHLRATFEERQRILDYLKSSPVFMMSDNHELMELMERKMTRTSDLLDELDDNLKLDAIADDEMAEQWAWDGRSGPRKERCTSCLGKGAIPDPYVVCRYCKGDGWLAIQEVVTEEEKKKTER